MISLRTSTAARGHEVRSETSFFVGQHARIGIRHRQLGRVLCRVNLLRAPPLLVHLLCDSHSTIVDSSLNPACSSSKMDQLSPAVRQDNKPASAGGVKKQLNKQAAGSAVGSSFPIRRPLAAIDRFCQRAKKTCGCCLLREQRTTGFLRIPAVTYFRTCGHYHRPQELNCRVRNGNECGLLGKFTGKLRVRKSSEIRLISNNRTSHASTCKCTHGCIKMAAAECT